MEQKPAENRNLVARLWSGLVLIGVALLVSWLLTAALVSIFPGFSYGLVERWVCPANTSIHVEGTAEWLFAVLADDESAGFPQVTCTDPQGNVVLRGDWTVNANSYLRIYGVYLLVLLPAQVAAYLLMARSAGNRPIEATATRRTADEVALNRLLLEISALEEQRARILDGRPHPQLQVLHNTLRVVAPLSVFIFGCLFAALWVAQGVHPFFLGGVILALILQITDLVLARRIGAAVSAWEAAHRDELSAIAARIAEKNAAMRRLVIR